MKLKSLLKGFYRYKKLQALSEVKEYQYFILLHEKFLQFDWLRAMVFQLNLKYKPFAGSSINK